MTDDEMSDEDSRQQVPEFSHSERLFAAFQQRHIRLRLHGTKLPPNYTVSLRLPSKNDRSAQPRRPKRKRRLFDPLKSPTNGAEPQTDSDSDHGTTQAAANTPEQGLIQEDDAALASESELLEDRSIRANNAYTGATNTINSIHQRHWFLTLDRKNSGFRKDASSGRWESSEEGSLDPSFFVRGRDVERSVVTGRSADEVMSDEGVSAFKGRKMWRAILE